MNTRIIAVTTLALLTVFAAAAQAELRHVEIKTLGMDWEICAHAVSVAMKKLKSVTQVRVSLKDGLTILDLKERNTTTVAELRQIIKNNGFVAQEATAVALGSVAADQKSFVVDGTSERLLLSSPPHRGAGEQWLIAVTAPGSP